MGFDPWSALAESTVGKVVQKVLDFIPDPQQKADLLLKTRALDLEEEKQNIVVQMQQLAINIEEAKSEHIFVSGGRPAFLWCGVAAFAYSFVLQPFLVFIVLLFNPDWAGLKLLPQIDWSTMAIIVVPLLGISSMRSSEKKAIIAAKQ